MTACVIAILEKSEQVGRHMDVLTPLWFRLPSLIGGHLSGLWCFRATPAILAPSPAGDGSRTILVAEDNAIAARVLQHLFSDQGFVVRRAENGDEALRMAHEQRPDLLLTDILMPQMDGFGLCREFKRDAQLRSVPVVFYSSTFTSPEDQRLAAALGAARFVFKSAGNAELLRAVHEVLDATDAGQPQQAASDADVERLYHERLVAKLNAKVQQLEQSEERFLHVVDLMPDVLFTISVPEFAPTFVSNAVSRMFGFTPDEVIADPHLWRRNMLDDDRPVVMDKLQFVVEHCAPAQVEARFRNKNGDAIIYSEIRYAPSCDGQGNVLSIIGVMTDITARKLAELETLESHRRLDTLMGNLPGMAYRCRNERDWRMEFVSEGGYALTGYAPAELIDNAVVAYNDLIVPEDRDTVWNDIQAALTQSDDFECVYRIQRKDGRIRWVWEKGGGVYDRKGKLLALEGFITDITSRREAEEAVRELARFPAENPSPVMRVSGSGTLIYANEAAARLLEAIGTVSGQPVPAEWSELCATALREGSSVGFEYPTPQQYFSLLVTPVVESGYCNFYGLDITQRRAAETGLRKLNRALRTLSVCNESLVRAEGSCANRHSAVVDVGGYRMAWVGYAEHDTGQTVRAVAWAGAEGRFLREAQFGWGTDEHGKGVTGTAIRLNQPIVMADLASPDYDFPYREQELARGYRAAIGLPLVAGGKVIGALTLFAGQANALDEEEIALLEQLAGDLGFGIAALRMEQSNAQSAERLQRALLETVRSISLTIEKRDPYTAGHQQRVANLAAAIAVEMGMPGGRVEGIRMGSMVHDIGKIYVPSEILNRPGRLNPVEFGIIQSHPQVGYDIIKDVEFPWPVGEMILQHHERLDGSGYPQGLRGEEITLEARILAVADVVEAMASHRPYRAGLGVGVALQEIESGRGVAYDPEVVDSCLRLFREQGYRLEE